MTYRLRLAHLYPEQMNIYGDRGNILTLTRRCAWRGVEVELLPVGVGAAVDWQEVDIAFKAGDASCSAGWTAASAGTSETLTFTPTSSTVAMHAMVVGGGRSVDVDATA